MHLASALSLAEDLTAFIAYDQQLFEAAAQAGLTCLRPGPNKSD